MSRINHFYVLCSDSLRLVQESRSVLRFVKIKLNPRTSLLWPTKQSTQLGEGRKGWTRRESRIFAQNWSLTQLLYLITCAICSVNWKLTVDATSLSLVRVAMKHEEQNASYTLIGWFMPRSICCLAINLHIPWIIAATNRLAQPSRQLPRFELKFQEEGRGWSFQQWTHSIDHRRKFTQGSANFITKLL